MLFNNLSKNVFWLIEDLRWDCKCRYNCWLHGPYGLAKVVEQMPFRYIVKYLRKYGAKIGTNCRFERGINLHRAVENPPFSNLEIGNNVYLGHNILLDLTRKIIIEDNVIIASGCQIWTHASYYDNLNNTEIKYKETFGNVMIKDSSIIYSGVIIANEVTVGKLAKVGAASLVLKDVGDKEFVAGIPAKLVK